MSAEDDVREDALAGWDASAEAWGRLADRWEEVARPVTDRMLHLAELVPGARVLELGAGAGEVGRRAAERVVPGGLVVVSDPAPKMVEQIRARIDGVDGAEAAEENAEWIDRPTASFDAALSRWGLMFPLDLDAAFRECRRVLKPGGRLVFATWTTPDENPWMSSLVQELLDQGLIDPPDPDADAPGPFRLGDPARIQTLVADAGFVEARSEPLSFTARYAGLDDYWDSQLQLSSRAREALALTNERGVEALREGLAERFAPYATEGGELEIPARALITVASA